MQGVTILMSCTEKTFDWLPKFGDDLDNDKVPILIWFHFTMAV